MLNECGSLDHESHTLYLQKAIKQCAELTSIVNNVLDTLHLSSENNPLFFETLSVIPAVQEALESREALRHHLDRVTLDIPEYITVRAEAQGLLHVLQHLLSNAFKYAPEKTPSLSARPKIYRNQDTPASVSKIMALASHQKIYRSFFSSSCVSPAIWQGQYMEAG
jgi:K+-sensing histidine kinase KdpD